MKSSYPLSLLLLSAFLISVLPANASVSASQLGAQKIVNNNAQYNWAGVVYSDYWSSWFWSGYNTIVSTFLYINVTGMRFTYVPNSLGYNLFGIWTALSPYPTTDNRITTNFLQAGYGFKIKPDGSVYFQWFVMEIIGGQLVFNKTSPWMSTNGIRSILVDMYNFGNGTVKVDFWYNNLWVTIYAPWQFSTKVAESAYFMQEAPLTNLLVVNGVPVSADEAELPFISSPQNTGKNQVEFHFTYLSSGQSYTGPSNSPASGTTIQATVFDILKTGDWYDGSLHINNYNTLWMTPVDGGSYSNGNWWYTFEYQNPNMVTYGL